MANTGDDREISSREIFDRQRRRIVRDRAYARTSGADFLHQIMADEILERLSLVKRSFHTCLVVGLAGAYLKTELNARGISVIIADAGSRVSASLGGVQCDEDRLPFADHSFDLIINIGALDTVNDLPGALALAHRILVPDGLFLAAFCGAESLPRLKSAMMQAEGDHVTAHIHPQIDVRTIGDLMTRVGLTLPVADSDRLNLRYSSFQRLLNDIRDFGGSNVLTGGVKAVGPAVYQAVSQDFHDRADPDRKTAETIELVYLCGWAPHPDQPVPARRGSGRMSLKTALSKDGEG